MAASEGQKSPTPRQYSAKCAPGTPAFHPLIARGGCFVVALWRAGRWQHPVLAILRQAASWCPHFAHLGLVHTGMLHCRTNDARPEAESCVQQYRHPLSSPPAASFVRKGGVCRLLCYGMVRGDGDARIHVGKRMRCV